MSFFENKTVWLTGASSGIGEAMVRLLDQAGARVILSARTAPALEQLHASLGNPDRHRVVPLDVTDEMAIADAAASAGAVDVLINNAGISQRGLAIESQLVVDRRIMEVNYFGAVALTKAVLPSMRESGAGSIGVVSSVLGKFGVSHRSAYAASKHALHGFFESLRAETRGSGIHITLACPGFVRTNSSKNALTPDGTPHGQIDEVNAGGMDAEFCAARILRAIEAKKPEVFIGRQSAAAHLSRLFPNLFRTLAARKSLKDES